MKINKLIIYSLLTAIFVSCESELDVDPRQREDATITLSTEVVLQIFLQVLMPLLLLEIFMEVEYKFRETY